MVHRESRNAPEPRPRKPRKNKKTIKKNIEHLCFYKYVCINGEDFAWHRICYANYHGKDPFPLDVDHQNLNKLDNSKKNLFKITTAKNNQNKPIYKNNKFWGSGIKTFRKECANENYSTIKTAEVKSKYFSNGLSDKIFSNSLSDILFKESYILFII